MHRSRGGRRAREEPREVEEGENEGVEREAERSYFSGPCLGHVRAFTRANASINVRHRTHACLYSELSAHTCTRAAYCYAAADSRLMRWLHDTL